MSQTELPEVDLQTSSGQGYGWFSIILHWLGALAIIVSFLTGEAVEGGRANSSSYDAHVAWSTLLAIPLVIRIVWRMIDGFKRTSDQAAIFHLLSKIVMVGFLLAIIVSVLTGILLPWSLGNPLQIWSLAVPSPMPRMVGLHEVLEETHEIATHLFIPLLLLHIAGALKHAFVDRDGVLKGIFVPAKPR